MNTPAPNSNHEQPGGRVWSFGDCTFDELRSGLRVHGEPIELEPKPLEVLHQLLLRPGQVIGKQELLESVWPDVAVVEASLTTAISKLRKALGDQEVIIRTVPRVGYGLAVPIRVQDENASEPRATLPDAALSGTESEIGGSRLFSFHRRKVRSVIAWAAAIVIAAVTPLAVVAYRTISKGRAIPGSVAVLPFQNANSIAGLEYLRWALPDEVATTLSGARSLSVRPVGWAPRYFDPAIDLQAVARELEVSLLVTGRFVLTGDHLQVTMEAVDAQRNRVVWRDTVNLPANDLLALQGQVAGITRGGLARAMGVTDFVQESEPTPKNKDAFELYLKSLALDGGDETRNQQGIDLLKSSLQVDPTYAPAWGFLALRLYTASRFGGGGAAMLQLSDAAAERQMALDPGAPEPVAELTLHLAERGELKKAHEQALELVRRRPDNANNHHVLSYVLRYGGSVEEAARECETTALLAAKFVWGSCSITYRELGDYTHARQILRKDLSSEWSKAQAIEIFLRDGETEEAIKVGPPRIPHWDSYKMALACAQHAPEAEIKSLANSVEVDDDPEANFFFAGHFAYCGQAQESIRFLSLAIKGGYCSYPVMDRDPVFAKIRNLPEFSRVRLAGMVCHDNFVANREETSRIPGPRPADWH
ncbi:MAG TPA: winged helix-turn-helix domain-containing protein [Candidatus Sulfotelmatobacter sp.]|nr:winged helix-turn-helix domain-containing protein [Candidatus Sulfotelmatobacter sp.]